MDEIISTDGIRQIQKSFLTESKVENENVGNGEWLSEGVLRAIFNLSGDGFIICNALGEIKIVNESFCEQIQIRKEKLLESYIPEFMVRYKDYTAIELNELFTLKESKLIWLKQSDEKYLPAKIIVRKVSSDKFLIVVNHDVIERWNYDEINQKMEELQFNKDLLEERSAELNILSIQLAQSEAELKELNASKDKFFSILAHDLKSPFSGLIGYMDLLVEDFDSLNLEEIKDYINSVHRMVGNIYDLTKNLLDWSRLQNGRMACNIKTFNLYEAVTYASNLVGINARNKEISIINEVDKNALVLADEMMLNLIFQNLLSNAIKFTSRNGKITISSKPMGIFHEVQVVDTGIGMSEETLQKIFRIESVHTTLGTENEKGTGLGLILCKEMIERQKGAISVQSKINEGTKFSFILPSANEDGTKDNYQTMLRRQT